MARSALAAQASFSACGKSSQGVHVGAVEVSGVEAGAGRRKFKGFNLGKEQKMRGFEDLALAQYAVLNFNP